MTRNEQAAVVLVSALVVGVMAQQVVRHEAAVLGLTQLELTVIGLALPAVLRRLNA